MYSFSWEDTSYFSSEAKGTTIIKENWQLTATPGYAVEVFSGTVTVGYFPTHMPSW
jgi:hypothetical protein